MDQQDKELQQLQQQLSEALAAENFFNTSSGKLIEQIINRRVNLSLKKITSDKFEKDHSGYVAENAWLRANRQLLTELQLAAHPQRKAKINSKLDEYGTE